MVETLCAALRSNDEEERDIASIGIRAMMHELQASERSADTMHTLVHGLVPFLTAQIDAYQDARQSMALDVLNDALTLAPSHVAPLQASIAPTLLTHMTSERSGVARRAIQGLAHLATLSTLETWAWITEQGLAGLVPPFNNEAASVHLLHALAREVPTRLATQAALRVEQIQGVLQRADERDETDELRESCLLTLQAMIAGDLDASTRIAIAYTAQSMLAYDPNATEEMDEEDEEDALDVSDDDDLAWRVRRAACRLLSDLFAAPGAHDLCAMAPALAAALYERLREREDTVRLDALAAVRLVARTCLDAPLATHHLVEALQTWRGASAQAAALTALSELMACRALSLEDGPAIMRMSLHALDSDTHAASYVAALGLVRHVAHQAPAMAHEAAGPLAASLARAVLSSQHRAGLEALYACEPFFANVSLAAPEPAGSLLEAMLARCERSDADASVHDAALVAMYTALCVMGERVGHRLAPMLSLVHARLSLETTRARCLQMVQDWADCDAVRCLAPVQACFHACLPLLADLASRPTTAVEALQALHAVARLLGGEALATVQQVVALGPPAPDASSLPAFLAVAELSVQNEPHKACATTEALVLPLVPQLARVPPPALLALCRFVSVVAAADEAVAPALFTALERAWDAQSHEPGASGAMAYAQCLSAAAASTVALPAVLARVEGLLQAPHMASQTLGYMTIGLLGQQGTLLGWPHAPAVYAKAATSTVPGQAMAMGGMLLSDVSCQAPMVQALTNGDASALRVLREALKLASESQVRSLAPRVWASLLSAPLCAAAPDATAECVARLVTDDAARFFELVQRMQASDACGRAMALGAVRAMLPLDREHDLDAALETCAPSILQKLSDEEVSVRHAAVMALRAGLQSRTSLLLQALPPFLASLYDLTRVRTELQRQVRMGPFTVVHDDGLDLRKNALETLGALLDTSLAPQVATDVLMCVVRALQDDDSVKLMGCLLLLHVADVASEAVRHALPDLAPPLQAILARKVRENATKQETEKAAELSQAALRVVGRLAQLDPASLAVAELLERVASAAPGAVRRAAP